MPTRARLTDAKVRALKPREERYTVWGHRGLGVRISPNRTKTWVVMYRFEGRKRRLTLGRYPQVSVAAAHKLHGEALASLERGIDPGATQVETNRAARAALSVEGLAEEYLEKWAKPRKRSWQEDERILAKDVLPAWRGRKAATISRRDVLLLLDGIVERGSPIAANRTLAVIRKVFNFGVARDFVPGTPCVQIPAPSKENRRDRVLGEDEIRKLWHGLEQLSIHPLITLALKLQLVTAQRKGELVGAEWSEIDLANSWWTIPAEKAKNGLPHRVPLSSLALSLLNEARPFSDGKGYAFPGRTGDAPLLPTSIDHALRKHRAALKLENVTPHDLRRTAASHMTSLGTSRLVVSKVLNHAEGGITAVYDRHSYDSEKRQALEAWGRKLQGIVSGETKDNVVTLSRR